MCKILLTFTDFFFNSFLVERSYFRSDARFVTVGRASSLLISRLLKRGELVKISTMYNNFTLELLQIFSMTNHIVRGVTSFFDIMVFVNSFFFNYKFLFYFFCEKLNKNIYKFSKYKLPKYSLKFFFVKPYKRVFKLINSFSRLVSVTQSSNFKKMLYYYLFTFFFNRRKLQLFHLFKRIHNLIFKNFQLNLFLLDRTV